MKKIFYLLTLLWVIDSPAQPNAQQQPDFFETVNTFLLENVDYGRINYNALKFNDKGLSNIIESIGAMDLQGKSDDYKLAFYINSYNLLVIQQVLDHYPIESPMNVPGFFKQNKFLIAGDSLTLDEIEFDKIVAPYQDPRIHFALGCAAKSCPFLYDNAYNPEHLQEQLQFRSEIIIDRPNYVEVDDENKTILMNKIFSWYKDQFEENAGSLITFVNKYRFYKVPKDYEIQFIEYDWSLNKKE